MGLLQTFSWLLSFVVFLLLFVPFAVLSSPSPRRPSAPWLSSWKCSYRLCLSHRLSDDRKERKNNTNLWKAPVEITSNQNFYFNIPNSIHPEITKLHKIKEIPSINSNIQQRICSFSQFLTQMVMIHSWLVICWGWNGHKISLYQLTFSNSN